MPNVPDINADLVKRGLAVAYRQYSMDYVDEEDAARMAGAGPLVGQVRHAMGQAESALAPAEPT